MPNQAIYLTAKDIARFESKFTKTLGCWNWTGYCLKTGYGRFGLKYTVVYAHRVAYTLYVGPVPSGLCVLHRCDNPGCVNPQHLWLGSQVDNIRDTIAKGRSRSGHPDGERNSHAKVTASDVRKIRELVRRIGHTRKLLAHRFDITEATISKIVNRKTWTHVTGMTEVNW